MKQEPRRTISTSPAEYIEERKIAGLRGLRGIKGHLKCDV
jgi:hypothetical protein